jgi:integrase
VHEPFPERPALLFDLVFPSRSEHLLLNLGIADAHGLTPMFAGLGSQKNAVPSPRDSSLHASRAYRIPTAAALEAVVMGKPRVKPNYRRRVLRLPDLDHCKTAVLNSLGSPASRRVYEYAIDQFVAWYCSEPRLAFNRIVVVRYRIWLESRHLAANTINQQLAAVPRLAHEAADAGLLSPELAAGISRVKGVKQLGFRSGNWLSAEQSSEELKHAEGDTMRAKRDYAMLAMLFGCGFRRSELVGLESDDIQMRQGHWAVVDLIGQRWPHSHGAHSELGESRSRSMDTSRWGL